MGTASHNTVMLGDFDQMRKGPGFIRYNWIQNSQGKWRKEERENVFEGYFEGFKQAGKGIIHRRRVTKKIGKLHWEIEDWIENAPAGLAMNQIWHPSDSFFNGFQIRAYNENIEEIYANSASGWFSGFYGHKERSTEITFTPSTFYLRTIIKSNSLNQSDIF